jgi:uncharacterized protein (DUF362 family)
MPVVSIAKSVDPSERMKQAIDLIGGAAEIVRPGQRVVIKINAAGDEDWNSAKSVRPEVIRALARVLKEAGPREIVVTDGHHRVPSLYSELADEVTLFDSSADEVVRVEIPGAYIHRIAWFPRILLEADVLISLAIQKTHMQATATQTIKNFVGAWPDRRSREQLHQTNLDQGLIDTLLCLKPALGVIDSGPAMEGFGPGSGDPIWTNLTLASRDLVAVDTIGCQVMGIDHRKCNHIRHGAERGIGCADLTKIEVVGERVEDVRVNFREPTRTLDAFPSVRSYVAGPCDERYACLTCVIGGLDLLKREGKLDQVTDLVVVAGRDGEAPADTTGTVVYVGNCQAHRASTGHYMPGCPPCFSFGRQWLGTLYDIPEK